MNLRNALLLPLALSACQPDKASSEIGGPSDTGEDAPCGPAAAVGLEVGQCAPDFTLPDRYGQAHTLSSYRGSVALVDISALW